MGNNLLVHDSIITSYLVDLEGAKIILNIAHYPFGESLVNQTIVFSKVLTHCFKGALRSSVIFDLEQYPIKAFIEDERGMLLEQKTIAILSSGRGIIYNINLSSLGSRILYSAHHLD